MSCRRVFSWIANLLIWGAIAFVGISFGMDLASGAKNGSIAILIICAIIYYCEAFICSYCSYFMHLSVAAKSYEDIDKMFKSSPLVTMNITCYHYRRTYRHRSRGGRSSSSSERVVTHRSSEEFRYMSWRDISGEFKLDMSGALKDENVAYVLLDLNLAVEFASDGTAEDYSRAKLDFVSRNRYDRYQDYHQGNSLPSFQDCFLIQVTDQQPCCFGLGYFIFFGLLTFNAIYSTYIDCYCHKQKFTVKKVISTRQNLSAPEMQSQYAYYDPRMLIANQMVVFPVNQDPQVMTLSQPIAQQYLNIPAAPSQNLFVAMPQGSEVMQTPEGVQPTMPPGAQLSQEQLLKGQAQGQASQMQLMPGQYPQNSGYTTYPPQYAPHMMPQQQYAQGPNMIPNPQVYPQNQSQAKS